MPGDLEARIQRLEDIESIRALKARYCMYCDDNYDVEGLASLFTEDAIWDGGIRGKAIGRDGIREFFQHAPERLPFAVHMVMNPLIEVNGDEATGVWYLFQACTYARGENLYITFDIDVMDTSQAPGTGTPEVGGLVYEEAYPCLMELVRDHNLVAMDLVEVAPPYDSSELTVQYAAKLIIDVLAARFPSK